MADLERAAQFVFEGVGSRGDIVPLMSVAGELVRRGYACDLLANEHFRGEAQQLGIGFFATTTQLRNSVEADGLSLDKCLFRTLDGAREYFQRPAAFNANSIVVNSDLWSASEPFAEALRLRTVRLHLFPVRIRSLLAPAWPLGAAALGPNGEAFRTRTLPALYRAADTHPKVLARINGVRAQVGLAAVDTAMHDRPHVVAQAALFPDWFGMPAPDWPELECLGFPLPRSAEPLPARLIEFLERVPPPLVFTPGTSVAAPERFFDAALDCCAELGMPGIILSPFSSPGHRQTMGPSIVHFDYIELERVLPHSAGLVHHGGLGTTARALQAGIPQIISPMGFDQPDNGHRVELLGVGRVVPRAELSGSTLAAALRSLLQDAALEASLARCRGAIAASRAVERCADFLETILGRSSTGDRVLSN